MRKFINILPGVLFFLLLCLTFSCEDSERRPIVRPPKPEPDKEESKFPANFIDIDGSRLAAINDYNIEYSDSFINHITKGTRPIVDIDYPKFTGGLMKLNEDGLLSHFETYSYYVTGGNTYTAWSYDTIKVDLYYDNLKYLIKTEKTHIYEYFFDKWMADEYSVQTDTTTSSYIWMNQNLVEQIVSSKKYNNYEPEFSKIDQYLFSYSSQDNAFRQFTLFLSENILNINMTFNIFVSLGLAGTGPEKLPSGIQIKNLYYGGSGEPDESKYINDVEYQLNDNGSIEMEIIGDNSYYYNYEEYN